MNVLEINNNYWLDRWKKNDIQAFHQDFFNPSLVKHFASIGLKPGSTVLVPLCGSSIDMLFFIQNKLNVIGIEISYLAAQSFFSLYQKKYQISKNIRDKTILFSDKIRIIVSDFFDLQRIEIEKPIDFLYDRGAYNALPKDLRIRYINFVNQLLVKDSKILLFAANHDGQCDIAPYSIHSQEIDKYFGNRPYKILETIELPSNLVNVGKTYQNINVFCTLES